MCLSVTGQLTSTVRHSLCKMKFEILEQGVASLLAPKWLRVHLQLQSSRLARPMDSFSMSATVNTIR